MQLPINYWGHKIFLWSLGPIRFRSPSLVPRSPPGLGPRLVHPTCTLTQSSSRTSVQRTQLHAVSCNRTRPFFDLRQFGAMAYPGYPPPGGPGYGAPPGGAVRLLCVYLLMLHVTSWEGAAGYEKPQSAAQTRCIHKFLVTLLRSGLIMCHCHVSMRVFAWEAYKCTWVC